MTQEDYLKLRNENRINEIAYDYYLEKGGKIDYPILLQAQVFTFIDFDSLLKELDVKYEVTLVTRDKQLIKVIPNGSRR